MYQRSYALNCLQPPPIVDMVLPYSVMVQDVAGVVEKLAVPHLMVFACIKPRLWPGSCMSTTQLSDPFIHVRLAGLEIEPSSPKPPQSHRLDLLK